MLHDRKLHFGRTTPFFLIGSMENDIVDMLDY